jgi:hypothetical protein
MATFIVGMSIGLSLAKGEAPIAVGLGVSTVLLLGPLTSYVKIRFRARSGRVPLPPAGTMAVAGAFATLPPLIIGGVCVVAALTYSWAGFPAGVFLGIGVFGATLCTAIFAALRTFSSVP